MDNVVVLILGGGRGTRLYPLTKLRSKPAVPIGGKYRLIDIPLSNCINSGLKKIYVITQFNSVSLHHHIHSYSFDNYSHDFVEILAAQQTCDNGSWYQGTADAVRQNCNYLKQRNIDYVLILSGDQLYRMDFRKMIEYHIKSKADVTISSVPVAKDRAHELGIMRLNSTGRVEGFLEKPQNEGELKQVHTDPQFIRDQGIDAPGREYLASMGIYLFNRDILLETLEKTDYTDFGKEVFPATIRTKKVQVYLFDGYWEDIGTIRSFYEANLAMAQPQPVFDISPYDTPTFSKSNFLPSTRIDGARISRSLIADGCALQENSIIENSVVGLRTILGKNCQIRNSILMGRDYHGTLINYHKNSKDCPRMGIGDNTIIDGAIIDKNCAIGKNVVITNPEKIENTGECFFGMIRDGVICVEKNTTIPDNWNLTEYLKSK
ncbi:MAG: glucose-1-phosphate adenylyltransferase [Planctomycetia bacterium]|nr:glucose-1-phosphate adenylyltransferase [Planctomycetia bacterium]